MHTKEGAKQDNAKLTDYKDLKTTSGLLHALAGLLQLAKI
jgi:hypothetical protein